MSSSVSDFGQNTWLVEEMYQQFIKDPTSVDPSWHDVLKTYKPESPGSAASGQASSNGGAAPARTAAPAQPTPAAPG